MRAALLPIYGNDRIARMYESLTRRKALPDEVREVRYNGLDGLMYSTKGTITDVLLFEVAEGGIVRLFAMRNPEKLARLHGKDHSPKGPAGDG